VLPSPLISAEDEEFLYLQKISGLPVFDPHQGEGMSLSRALLEVRAEQVRPLDGPSWPEGFTAGIVHRLDGWTSGLVIAARSLAALERARALFSERRLVKRYFFLSDRAVNWDEHLIEHALAHDRRKRSKMIWKRGKSTPHRGRWNEASTALARLGDRAGGLSLWQATMSSGVMHQIRIHAASAGLPLLGDRLYGGSEDPRGGGRFYLHHSGLEGWPSSELPSLDLPAEWP
jgi:23S rRNA pseudouridine1911/1915/1917 synthase